MYGIELELAKKAALAAGSFLREREEIRIDSQEKKDIKLSSDKRSEKIIMDILKQSNLPVLSEEYGERGKLEDCYWIVDPLDGSFNYYKGLDDLACVSIALWKDDFPVLGVVYRFHKDELFWGEMENGAFLNGKRIETSQVEQVGQAVLATGLPVNRSYKAEDIGKFIEQIQRFKKIRMLGTAAVMGALVACGKMDAYYEEQIMLWDIAASVAIVRAAGGYVNVKFLKDYQCICSCFATKELWENYYDQSL